MLGCVPFRTVEYPVSFVAYVPARVEHLEPYRDGRAAAAAVDGRPWCVCLSHDALRAAPADLRVCERARVVCTVRVCVWACARGSVCLFVCMRVCMRVGLHCVCARTRVCQCAGLCVSACACLRACVCIECVH